ncbi:MAG: hypothetical protein H7Z41_13395 [Cytophagales bacterium]|nr:hypothetical protein [Armatimonadota bacterium]
MLKQNCLVRVRWLSALSVVLTVLLGLLPSGCGGGGGGGGELPTVVRGTVRDSARSDQPVGGATVTIGGVTATTNAADGSFEIRGAALGTTLAVVTAPAQAPQTLAFAEPVDFGARDDLILTLNIGQIRGRVVLGGQPVAGAQVTELTTGFSIPTSQDGRFLLESIPPGASTVFAIAATASVSRQIPVVNGVNEAGDLVLVDETDTNPPPAPPATLIGKITLSDQPSAAAAGTAVLLLRGGIQIEDTVTDAAGEYRFYVPPGGGYSVLARRNAYQDALSGPLTITDPSVPLRADLTMNPN